MHRPTYDAAVRRARRMDEQATNAGEPLRHPTTGVYRLIESIRTDSPAK